ncbi:putative quorum-sensing-regulated virulence factor [Rhabdochlamydiaceae symbiont of Dictyostelium giganteum]|uniref:putative quorum-sensing-regulated virulence factor n=1 Tax=Rhabdochlamydiaceae symbiont of Dictyostelium giganteum TaxID=3342349 RepID=UPI00384EC67B
MPLRPIYYDTETTGVRSEKDRIIEIAAYDPIRDATFVKLVNPECPIPAESTAITSITDSMVADAPTFGVVGLEFMEFCGEDVILIAHNNDRFDKHFLAAEAARANLIFPAWKQFDTLKWARKYRPDLPSHALQALREIYGFESNQAHRALDDVITLYRIFSVMFDDIPIETAFSLLYETQDINRMPFGKYQGRALSEVPPNYLDWLKKNGALDKIENKDLKEALAKLNLI